MLLLVLLTVCSKIEFFPTGPTCVYFLLPHLFLALQPSAKCFSRLGCTSYEAGSSQVTNVPWECKTVTLLQICSVQMVSLHPGLHAKNLKKTSDGEDPIDFIGVNDTITIVRLVHERSSPWNRVQDTKLESH